jgi:hypothetical protein
MLCCTARLKSCTTKPKHSILHIAVDYVKTPEDGLKAVAFRKMRRAGRASSALGSGWCRSGIDPGHQISVHPLRQASRLQASNGEMAVLVAEDMILILRGAVDTVATVRLVEHQLAGHLLREKYLAGVRGVS